MKKITNAIDRVLIPVLIALMAGMVIDVTWQVASRYLLKAPSSYTEEIARYMLIWIGLLGAAYAYRTRMHLGLDLLTSKLTGSKKLTAELFSIACVLGFTLVVMIIGGTQLMLLTFELKQQSSALGIKIGYVYSVIPLSGVIIALYSIDSALQSIRSHSTAKEEK